MKKLILAISFLIGIILSSSSQEKESFTLTIEISGLKSNKGTVITGIYNSQIGFLKKQYKSDVAKIKNKKATIVFKNLTVGEYAVSFIHDENKNNKMDTNFFGIPIEDYGCSNNAKGFMGPPKYQDEKFLLTRSKTIQIKI
jgi:uncharacterized protein (DUF2141 family)